jgi:hypothetical protein
MLIYIRRKISMLDNVYHLFARHPELSKNQDFLAWLKTNGAAYWYDTPRVDGDAKVVVVAKDEASLFAALEQSQDGEIEDTKLVPDPRLAIVGHANLTDIPPREIIIRKGIENQGFSRKDVISIRPNVEFDQGQVRLTGWDVRIATDRKKHFMSEGEELKEVDEADLPDRGPPRGGVLIAPGADDMADNELHTTWALRQEAESWTQGPLTVSEKARRIGAMVSQTYAYDGSINLISEFTWRDTLTRDRNGRRGICDEYAVVQITYLRSIGIPARLKFLIWTDAGGQGVGHACLEFNDNGSWFHMDGLWNAFKDPARYRRSGAQNLTVMDADYPLESRSDQPAWGKPDVRGDGLLYPYGDFIVNPRYPGNSRPGYSN